MNGFQNETQIIRNAKIIDLQERREAKQRKISVYLEAMEDIHELRSQIADYDFYMSVLALEISPEQLPELGPLSAEQQIQEDLNRLNGFVNALERIVEENKGVSLATARHLMQKQGHREYRLMLDYLAQTDCPFLAKMHEILNPAACVALEKQA
ncbi:MAG: hypothetical protein IT572_09965 [Deltaproteobacteria bacterium]|nr:hypothetical protein [Deltaproteobacteria bacterium]